MAKNKIRGTEYEDLIYQVVDANLEAYDRDVRAEALLEVAAENAEPTDEAIRKAIHDEMANICNEHPAPHEQPILDKDDVEQ
ncbi:hypothetical protein Pan241w_35930 [Gimesia alba]|uniref:Uncharacterized protein n=1 Tax=Gimesia alba TaxID=2527973 RepID=A0A517RHZ1_9PLAN|nr:hypothetical protein [Gimesia alba]QDT43492.1 hypothetical protein Pan241w_35930 [Gimesia alba]